MARIQYQNLNVLVADDFSNFRSTVNRMLMELGAMNVDMASNSEEIIEQCARKNFDVVLCDYNLGSGRNGQQVLEELRFRKYLSMRSVFVLVSAEASRNIVMSAYDSAPDDYLMKPITTQMLHNRLDRLLVLRKTLGPVYGAIEQQDPHTAMDLLIDMSIAEDRHSTAAQKLLGEMFLEYGEYYKAEKLYMSVLEVRELDWARLGLAKAKQKQGNLEQAGQWLEKIIEDNYLFLPAYDVLSENWLERGESVNAQEVVQRSVDVSPMSILRQKNLAKLATKNNDLNTAVDAYRKVVKLGKQSCYGSVEDSLNLMRTLSSALESEREFPISIVNEAFSGMDEIGADLESYPELKKAQLMYLNSRLLAVRGNRDKAQDVLVRAETILPVEDSDIDTEVDHIRALIALGYPQKVDFLLERLQELYAHDQEALQKLDEFLDEPASDANKAIVAQVNHEGIELYNDGEFDKALECFKKATDLFPKHIGLQLNIVQALIGKLKGSPNDEETQDICRTSLESIATSIDQNHSQYKRFAQLKHMARTFYDIAD